MANTSDEDNTRFCEPCKYLGLQKTAISHCEDCTENLCDSCTITHGSFKATRGHKVTNFDDELTVHQKAIISSILVCTVHPSETLTRYCEKDKQSICRICHMTTHRNCKTNFLRETTLQDEFKDTEKKFIENTKCLLHEVKEIRNSRKTDKIELDLNIRKIKDDLRNFKAEIISWVQNLEMDMLEQISNAEKEISDKIDDHLTTSDAIIKQLEDLTNSIEAIRTIPEAVFVQIQKQTGPVKDAIKVNDDIKREIKPPKIDFRRSDKLEELMSQIEIIGTLNTCTNISRLEVTDNSTFSVLTRENNEKSSNLQVAEAEKMADDFMTEISKQSILPSQIPIKEVASFDISEEVAQPFDYTEIQSAAEGKTIIANSNFVSGCTFLPGGELVICDSQNDEVKLFTPDFELKSTFSTGYPIWDVTTVSSGEVVVTCTFKKQIQFLNISDTITKGKTIPVGMDCYGIDFKNERLYVSGMDDWTTLIKVLTMNGDIMNTFYVGFRIPYYIAVNSSSTKIIVCDGSSGVWCADINGTELYTCRYTGEELKPCRGVLFDSYDNFMVCGERSNNVHVVKKDGTKHRILLTSRDGMDNPRCIAYRESDKTLIVGQSSGQNSLLAFKLN